MEPDPNSPGFTKIDAVAMVSLCQLSLDDCFSQLCPLYFLSLFVRKVCPLNFFFVF